MMTGKILFKEQTDRIIGACFDGYKEKGNGFLEAAWLVVELRALSKDRARTGRQSTHFACFAYFVVSESAVHNEPAVKSEMVDER